MSREFNNNNPYINKITTDVQKFGSYSRIVCNYDEAYEIMMERHLLPGEPCVVRYYENVYEDEPNTQHHHHHHHQPVKKVVKAMLAVGAGVDNCGRELTPIIVTSDINAFSLIVIDGREYNNLQDAFDAVIEKIDSSSTSVVIDGTTYPIQDAVDIIVNRITDQGKVTIAGNEYTLQQAFDYIITTSNVEPIPEGTINNLIDTYLKK